MILEVRHFRLLEAISATGTVTAAAKRVYLTQPAVSHALRELEGRLGVQLFRRERARMTPTAVCRRLLRAGEVILREVALAEHELRQFRTGDRGTVRLAVERYTAYHWLPDVIRELHAAHPHVDVQVVGEARVDPLAHLRSGRIDLAIVESRPEGADVAVHEVLGDEEIVAVVSVDHPLARKRFLRPRDFAGQPLVIHAELEHGCALDEFLRAAHVERGRVTIVPVTDAAVDMVTTGIGMIVVPRWVIAPHVAARRVAALRVGSDGVFRSWYAAVPRAREGLPYLKVMVDCIRAQRLGHAPASSVTRRPLERGA